MAKSVGNITIDFYTCPKLDFWKVLLEISAETLVTAGNIIIIYWKGNISVQILSIALF